MHIKIRVLLTPGNTTPIDIRKPDIIKNRKEKLVSTRERFSLSSKNTKIQPTINEVSANNRYLNLKVYLEFIFFNRIGMLPKIKPIKQKLVCVGKRLNKDSKIFPSKNTPTSPPRKIGNKYEKFFLKFLNNPKTELINLSYIPNMTHRTPLLTPGRIAPAPSNMPIKKFQIFFKSITNKLLCNKNGIMIEIKAN